MKTLVIVTAAAVFVAAAVAATVTSAGRRGIDVLLCDGKTSLAVERAPTDAAGGRQVAMQLMQQWQQANPEQAAAWQQDQAPQGQDEALLQQRFQLPAPYDNKELLPPGQSSGETYGDFKAIDLAIWQRATHALVLEGAQVFHDADRLGSTISVSCDMCHPDAANTHPETYPKYQTQIGKAVLLRDMINWCLQHPVRAPKMADDDPRMKAMEAYILARRVGKPLQFGKH